MCFSSSTPRTSRDHAAQLLLIGVQMETAIIVYIPAARLAVEREKTGRHRHLRRSRSSTSRDLGRSFTGLMWRSSSAVCARSGEPLGKSSSWTSRSQTARAVGGALLSRP